MLTDQSRFWEYLAIPVACGDLPRLPGELLGQVGLMADDDDADGRISAKHPCWEKDTCEKRFQVARWSVDDQLPDCAFGDCSEYFCDIENVVFHHKFSMLLDLCERPFYESRKISAKNCA